MAKRSKVKKKAPEKKNDKEIAHLEKLKSLSLKNVNGMSEGLDELFSAQAKKIQGQIDKLKEKQWLISKHTSFLF